MGNPGRKKGVPANAVHPGEMLREEFLVPLGIKPAHLAKSLGIPVPRINDLVRERRAMTADTALRLSRYFGNSAQFWMNLQSEYDLDIAVAKGKGIQKIKPREERVA
jgi:addiction module HigA family antidote